MACALCLRALLALPLHGTTFPVSVPGRGAEELRLEIFDLAGQVEEIFPNRR
jgi:hypothetical protein